MKRRKWLLGLVLILAVAGCGKTTTPAASKPSSGTTAAPPVATPAPSAGRPAWSPRAVLTLSAQPQTMSPLVLDGGSQYLVAQFGGTYALLTNAGGSWHQYKTGVSDAEATNEEGRYWLTVSRGIAYIPYLNTKGDVKLAFDPAGPSGNWADVTVEPRSSGAACGLGTEPEAPQAAVVGGVLAVAFDDASACNRAGGAASNDVYVFAAPLSALTAGGSPTWQKSTVTADYANGGDYPAVAADGGHLDLTYELGGYTGAMDFVQGTPGGANGFTWPASPQAAGKVSNQGMDRPKMTLAASGGIDLAALGAGGNVVDTWALSNAGGTWSSSTLAKDNATGTERPTTAVASCGQAVAYTLLPSGASANQVTVATLAGGQWTPQSVGAPEQSLHSMWPGIAAIPGGFDLTYVNDDSGSAVLYLASESCGFAVVLTIGSTNAQVGGRQETLPMPAQIVDGRTFVPLRFVSEALGAKVSWDAVTREVTISQNGQTVVMTEGQTGYAVNGGARTMDVAPYVAGAGYTMVPVRFASEALGYHVKWNGAAKQVTVTH
ncbi:MAG: copper amine oxidase N-terminal domain-containing protein [Thermaerobacter sp.]|nr:copper amine oxidase N-terminal domain-containing protein [Thermaerobacter sp.]